MQLLLESSRAVALIAHLVSAVELTLQQSGALQVRVVAFQATAIFHHAAEGLQLSGDTRAAAILRELCLDFNSKMFTALIRWCSCLRAFVAASSTPSPLP